MKQQLNQLAAYQPGLSPQALKEKHGIEGELYKLASNENLYGPSPKAKQAVQAHLDELFYYPETGSPSLRKAISEHLNGSFSNSIWCGVRRSYFDDFKSSVNARR